MDVRDDVGGRPAENGVRGEAPSEAVLFLRLFSAGMKAKSEHSFRCLPALVAQRRTFTDKQPCGEIGCS